MKIGADELILWLRKNEKALKIPNDGFNGLGQIIYDIIVNELSGKKVEDNYSSFWANAEGDKNIDKYLLPKSSAQYEIDIEKLPELYRKIKTL